MPPPGLRRRVLDDAGRALARPPKADVWARLAGSRTARLAWAASVLLLLAANLVVPRHRTSTTIAAHRGAPPSHELADTVRLPEVVLGAGGLAASAQTLEVLQDLDHPGSSGTRDKENPV